MNSCEFVTFISSLACSIAKCYDSEELALIGFAFTQLGDTLTTIAVREELCQKNVK